MLTPILYYIRLRHVGQEGLLSDRTVRELYEAELQENMQIVLSISLCLYLHTYPTYKYIYLPETYYVLRRCNVCCFSVLQGKIFECLCLWLPLQLPRSEREEKIGDGESNAFLLFAVTEWWWKEVFALLPLDNNLSHFDGAKKCKKVAAQQVAAGGQRQNNRRPTNMANLTW